MIIKISICFCLFLSSFAVADNEEFQGENELRTANTNACYNIFYNMYCKIKCGSKTGLCIGKQCYCMMVVNSLKTADGPQMIYYANPDEPIKQSVLDWDDDKFYTRNVEEEQEVDESLDYALRPTVRHHIAHFCPNLDVARQCIRTCMKVGKPAFCGKDHVCYCGHKYSSTDDTSGGNLEDTYAQFRDLYEKYFGVQSYAAPEEIVQ